ncbi:glycosyltransferase family 4 protein [bacterium]|nr:glycosyltransferase family 4 protein [bacterium]
MRIIQIIPGTGGQFYCENCVRDTALVRGLREMGHDVLMVPLYLPLSIDEPDLAGESPIFFGAVNVYLKQTFAPFRNAPGWIQKMLDSPFLLDLAARQAGSTRSEGLEEMTLSMLRGEKGNQAGELEHLIKWLKTEGRPDVVHLANALLIGLAPRIREELQVPVVCSLQDEDTWLDSMDPGFLEETIWVMTDRAKHVDAFIPVSRYFSEKMQTYIHLPAERFFIVPVGLDLTGYEPASLDLDPPIIGYLSRLCPSLGLGILIDAFLILKKQPRFQDLKLHLTGGMTGDDRAFVHKMKKKLQTARCLDDVLFIHHFDRESRIGFLKRLSILTVPIPHGEAFGTFQIESLAAGVPVVQPNVGAFPEFIREAGGGVLYEPNDAEHLAEAIAGLLENPEQTRQLASSGREKVLGEFCLECMTRKMVQVYTHVQENFKRLNHS